jgi:hypothetical protein
MLVKRIAAYSVLISVCLTLANVGVIASRYFSRSATVKRALCPLHASHCCCPIVCKDFQQQVTDKECHRSTSSGLNARTRKDSSSSSSCFLKAGCGEQDFLVSSDLFQKILVARSRIISKVVFQVSSLPKGLDFGILPGYSSRFFHPPRTT